MEYLVNTNNPIIPQVLKVLQRELEKESYQFLIVSATSPATATKFIFPGVKTIVFMENHEHLEKAESCNGQLIILPSKHPLKDIAHSSSHLFRSIFPSEIMALTLAGMEESIRKCVEIAVNAVDKNIISAGTRIIALAGMSTEPDTAIVIEPEETRKVIDTKILKILCRPYQQNF